MSRHPERTAAVVNAFVVIAIPLAWALFERFADFGSDTSVTVRPEGVSRLGPTLRGFVPVAIVLLPFAALAAWRTWVHASRRLAHEGRPWQGVIEAGACGLAIAFATLAPGIVSRPWDAGPYVIFYGAGALMLGLLTGLILHASAVVVLKVSGQAR